MLNDIAWFANHYPQIREIGNRRNLGVPQLLLQSVKKFDREFVEPLEEVDDSFLLKESGALSYQDARSLYKRLSQFFAQHGARKLTAENRQDRGKKGADARWKKE